MHLRGILIFPLLLTGCGTVSVALGTPLSGSVETGESQTTGGADTGGTTGSDGGTTGGSSTGGSSTGGSTQATIPTTCTPNADTFANYAQAVLATNCTGCHRGKFDTLDEVKGDAAMAQNYIASGGMPPPGNTPLNSNDQVRLVNWYLCKTP